MEFNFKDQVIVDSSVWISFFVEKDTNHKKSLELLDMYVDDIRYIPDLIFSEVTTVLKDKAGLEASKAFIDFVMKGNSIEIISLSEDIQDFAYMFLEEKYKNLSFIDTCLVYMFKKYNCKILTFDKDVLKFLGK